MAITVTKTLTSSDWYTGTGSTTITLADVQTIDINSKKSLIKIQLPESSATQAGSPSDKGRNFIKDLKKVEDVVRIKGWITDNAGETAWNKAWKLRAMESSGGPVDNLTIENVVFSSATQQAFLERVFFSAKPLKPTYNKNLNEVAKEGLARIEVDLTFFIGDER